MLSLARNRTEVRVVADQQGNPTSAQDIADALVTMARNVQSSARRELRGRFHLCAPDSTTWADLAKHVFAVSADLGGPSATVVPISTAEYPTPARRPANSRLDCSRLTKVHGILLPSWRTSAARVVADLIDEPN
jgi:dTDP-4-dehydrorhamnose reductase